jgi:hypothetical protein
VVGCGEVLVVDVLLVDVGPDVWSHGPRCLNNWLECGPDGVLLLGDGLVDGFDLGGEVEGRSGVRSSENAGR